MRRRPNTFFDLMRDGVEALIDEGKAVREQLAQNADTRRGRTKPTAEERLLRRRERKRRAWLRHIRAYVSVIAGLVAINIIIGVTSGDLFPWALIVAASWGMGLAMHTLGYKAWLSDNARTLRAAESTLGLPAPEPEPALLPRRATDGADAAWAALLGRCREAVERTERALKDVAEESRGGQDVRARLREGLADVEQLARGAEKVRGALAEIAPDGAIRLDQDLRDLDGRINAASDERLRNVYLANRTLLQARQAKVAALASERERMYASAEGFLLAAENLRLDAARLGAGHVPAANHALNEPLARLSDEVSILRQVEAELEKV